MIIILLLRVFHKNGFIHDLQKLNYIVHTFIGNVLRIINL